MRKWIESFAQLIMQPTLKMKTQRLLLMAVSMLLTSCESIFYAEGYTELVPYVDTNPASDAIVGMWNRRSSDIFGEPLASAAAVVNNSLLFRSDYTGVATHKYDIHNPGFLDDTDVDMPSEFSSFTWRYIGGGVWEVRGSKGGLDTFRVSREKLLRERNLYGVAHLVYERVN